MLLKLISCNVFQREACWCVARSPHVVDVEFTELGAHVNANLLRQMIQSLIDAADASPRKYDAILLLFGLCGNATAGLRAGPNTKLVLPRAHDCCTILLGSKQAFERHFKDAPSTPFSSSGYVERGSYFMRTADDDDDDTGGVRSTVAYGDAYAQLVAQYGEEDAKYIWDQMHPPAPPGTNERAVFINLPQTAHLDHAARFREKAQAAGKSVEQLEGDIRLIANLIDGRWDKADFLSVPPAHEIVGVYDWSEIVRAKPTATG
jgi:hypothetical protein